METQITVTDKAQIYLTSILEENQYFRVMILSGGCGGYRYHFDIENNIQITPDDIIISQVPKVIIDIYSAELIPGAEIDWVQGWMTSGFTVRNPNASSCGCGISFNPRN